MANGNFFSGDGFANGVFADLNMAETFGGHVARPCDTRLVVVVNGCGGGAEDVEKGEILEDVPEMKDIFCALVRGVNF